MSCNCQNVIPLSPEGDCLPTIADECALEKTATVCKPCATDPNCLLSDQSDGTTLSGTWLDACCHASGLILLGRVGSKLARFAGSGFIKIENGYASVVSAVPLQLTTLWHRWWKPTKLSKPILGEPLTYPYQVIASSTGSLHAIKGPADEDSAGVWDSTTKEFAQKPLSELPLARKGLLPRLAEIELVGYAAIAADGSPTQVRDLSTLAGSGVIIVEQQDTVDTACECNGEPTDSKASVARFLPYPEPVADEVFVFAYSSALGPHWLEK